MMFAYTVFWRRIIIFKIDIMIVRVYVEMELKNYLAEVGISRVGVFR